MSTTDVILEKLVTKFSISKEEKDQFNDIYTRLCSSDFEVILL
jgi:hypothetical protein